MAPTISWCEHCQNTGSLDCHCGGDLCICENYGEYPCPYCDDPFVPHDMLDAAGVED
jgi:hypothetical protein